MSGVLRLSNSVTGRSTIIASASNDQTFTLPALGGTLLAGGSSLEVIFPSGSEALPGLHVQGDTDTGLYAPAANTLGISTAGSERLRIASTGNVGIGTSNPSTLLHLAANAPYITFEDIDNNQDWQLQATAWFALRNQTTASELLRVTSAGLVGIGTSSPNTNLEVVATRTISSVDSFGQLVVKTTSGATGNMLNIGVDETNSRSFIQSLTRGTTSRSLLLNPYGGNVLVGTDSTTGLPSTGGLKVKSNGIGTASSAAALALEGTGGDFYAMQFTNNNFCLFSGSSSAPNYLSFQNGSATGLFYMFADGKIQAPGIYSYVVGGTNRDVYIDNAGYLGYVSSTRESKTNIVNLKNIDWLYALEPVRFNRRKLKQVPYTNEEGVTTYIDSPDKEYSEDFYLEIEYGLIAEDVKQVAPEFCFYDIVDGQPDLRGVHYNKLIAPLLKAVQDLKAENESLKGRLDAAGI